MSKSDNTKIATVFFFVGTEAELIKVFPIMLECEKRNIEYKLIASGQNDVEHSRILKTIGKEVDFALDSDTHITTGVQLIKWWIKVYMTAKKRIRKEFPDVNFRKSVMIVHGDTVSTVMGAMVGKRLKMEVAHVEAGLRSYHLFNPLPEEIDRIVTSMYADVHFPPGDIPERNLRNTRGIVRNTRHNTLADSLKYAMKVPLSDESLNEVISHGNGKYFVFVLHRQENLINKRFVCNVVKKIEKLSEERKCVILLHHITKNAFEKFGLMEELENNKNVVLFPRINYFDFMKLLKNASYVISDGGSNQEELFYMGKPCLIMRKSTERDEGVGLNGIMFDGNIDTIDKFARNYKKYNRGKPYIETSPSSLIVDYIEYSSVINR